MTDIASLQIRVTSSGIEDADRKLSRFEQQGRSTERATDRLGKAFTRLVGPLLGIVSATAGLRKLVDTERQFGLLSASLETATGSAENAAAVFVELERFATETPFALDQSVNAFTQLVNLGLTPSEKALQSYGNTASAMGKDLNQLVEAVADATVGEFERLKEFGIKTKSEGDNVSFTFRGLTTTVRNNAEEIEGYLIALGENEFAGAMAKRMETLDGAISNLGDTWNQTFRIINKEVASEPIRKAVHYATEALAEFNAMLASGQLEAYLTASASKFDAWRGDFVDTLNILRGYWKEWSVENVGVFKKAIEQIDTDFSNLPENIRAFIQIMTIELATFVNKTAAYGTEILENLRFWEDESFDLEARLRLLNDVRKESITQILKERDAGIESFKGQISAADDLRKTYDDLQSSREKVDLESFKTGRSMGDATSDLDKAAARQEEPGRKQREREFDQLVASLRTEEEAIQDSYDRRLHIILQNTEAGSHQQQALKARLDRDFATQALGELAEPDTVEEELARLEKRYQAKRELIRQHYGEQSALEVELTKQKEEKKAHIERQAQQQQLQQASDFFGGIAQIAAVAGGKESRIFKAAAIAQATIKTYEAATSAYASLASIPYVGPALGAAAAGAAIATGLANVQAIRSTNYAGAYDVGGMIPAGKIGMVGEYGPELISGPATITSRRTTADGDNGQPPRQTADPPPVQNNIRIINSVDPSVMEDYLGSSRGEKVILNVVKRNGNVLRGLIA